MASRSPLTKHDVNFALVKGLCKHCRTRRASCAMRSHINLSPYLHLDLSRTAHCHFCPVLEGSSNKLATIRVHIVFACSLGPRVWFSSPGDTVCSTLA